MPSGPAKILGRGKVVSKPCKESLGEEKLKITANLRALVDALEGVGH